MTGAPLIPSQVFSLLHLVEFGARVAGHQADSDALQKIEPTIEAAARGLQMMLPAITATMALVGAHLSKGAAPAAAVESARDHIQASPVFDQQDGGR